MRTDTDATRMTQQLSGSFGKMERNALRMSDGDRISSSGDDSGNLSVSLKVRARQKITAKKIENVGNAISFLQVQEGVLNSAKRIMDRIGILKTMYEDPAKSVSDKANYDMEFKELAEQLQELKNETFNGISLFSDTGSGFALNEGSAREFSAAMNDSAQISISQNVIDFEDLRRMGEAGEAVSRGFGGLKVINFPVKDSVAQVETITIGGRIAQGDEFSIRIIEQSSILETESDTTLPTYVATAADEAAANPNQRIRDALVGLINADANITNFVTIDTPTNNSFTLTSKMAGDPFTVTSGSTGSTGSYSDTNLQLNDPKVAQVDDLTINLNGNAPNLGDTVSVEVNGTPILYPVQVSDASASDLAFGLANAINGSAAGANVNATRSGSTVRIEALTAGTPFTLTNPSISIASGAGETIANSNVEPNFGGQAQVEEVTIGSDDPSPGGGQIAAGDQYGVIINGVTLTATAAAGATNDTLKNDLIGQINGAGFLGVNASSTGTGKFTITANDPGVGFSFSRPENLSADSLSRTTTIPNVSPFSILKSMNFLSEMLSQNAAEQQRLKLSQQHLSSNRMQYEVADGRIRDLDIASESTSYAKSQVRTQMLQSLLTQANASAANILSLIT